MGRLAGEIAIVTGAAQGIGRACVEAFTREGARVIASDKVMPYALQDIPGVSTLTMDVRDAAGMAEIASENRDTSIVLHCAGVVPNGTVLDCTLADWDLAFEINVKGAFHLAKAFLPAMVTRKRGVFLSIASVVSSLRGVPNRAAYGASKAALIGLTKSIAADFVTQGVRCNCICPGTVESPSLAERMAASGNAEKARKAFIARQPMGRLGLPAEIAEAAVYLASPEAAYVTGTALVVDGGMTN